ncbi:MAG: hypothetical protein H0W07_04310 [Chloroflexi bacterium]|nr:hypothetical protein [Chloroflexota bacterium]
MELADAIPNAATMTCTFNFVPKDPAVPASGGYVTLQADPTNRDTSLAIARDFYPEGEDVSGIGERAYWAKNIGMLIFVKGIVYTVQVRVNESGSRQKEIATKIAQLVLTKV